MDAVKRAIGASRRRGQRGFASLRVLIALTASSVVTVGVAVPMGYQAYQANQAPTEQDPADGSTTEGDRGQPPPEVAGRNTIPERPSLALPPLTTEATATTQPPATTTTAGRSSATTAPPATTTAPPATAPTTGLQATTTTGPPSTTAAPTTTVSPSSDEGLVWSAESGLRDLRRLQSARLSGRTWIYLDRNPATVTEVRFWLDDPTGAGAPFNVERQFPYSLVAGPTNGQPAPLDTEDLGDGPHTVRAEVVGPGGTDVRLATFTVDNG